MNQLAKFVIKKVILLLLSVTSIVLLILLYTHSNEVISRVPFGVFQLHADFSQDYSTPAEVSFDLSSHKVVYPVKGLDLYIHTAFIDDRHNNTWIRIFGFEKKDAVTQSFKCKWVIQDGGVQVTQEVMSRKYLIDKSWPDWSPFYASMFDCQIPRNSRPRMVLLESTDQKYSTEVPVEVTRRKTPKRDLAVCIKPITGSFKVARFVEWIEIQRAAGINNFVIYNADLFGASRYVLEYYEKLGIVTTFSFPFLLSMLSKVEPPTLTGQDRYAVYQQIYLVAMNDCLYRFRGSYKNIAFIDLDEVILPINNETLPNVLEKIASRLPDAAGYEFFTSWHFEDFGKRNDTEVPENLYMQQYATGTIPSDNQPKSILVTDRAVTLNFHSLLDVYDRGQGFPHFTNNLIPWQEYGYVHHYRGMCSSKFPADWCADFWKDIRLDPVMIRYKKAMNERVEKVLDHLQLK